MKLIPAIILILTLIITSGFSQDKETKHFEIDVMLGMHQYSSSFFHAMNSVTWNADGSNKPAFSGFGTSILPAFNVSYFFENNIGITAGVIPINAENDLYIDDPITYDYSADQLDIHLGVTGRVTFSNSPFALCMGTGLVLATFDLTTNIETATGGTYLSGNSAGLGFYANTSFQINIISFLNFKSELTYSFIPSDINLNDSDGNIEQNINNLNIGGTTLKTGLTFQF